MSGLLWRLKVHSIISVIILILFYSCSMPSDPTSKEDIYIDSSQIIFDENSNDLYIALNIINYESVDSVITEFYKSDLMFYSFNLNDNGINGDILPSDGLFSLLENLPDFEYGEYSVNHRLIDIAGNVLNSTYIISILENNLPNIVEVQIDEIFYLDSLSWTNLNIGILAIDLDGLSDIDYVRYMVNTDYLTKDDPLTEVCDHYNLSVNEYNGYISDPSWVMEYNSTIDDSIYQYITSIPMRPSIECGGYGIVLFKFIVKDKNGDSVELSNVTLEIISCGDGICNGEEDCNICSVDCGDCND